MSKIDPLFVLRGNKDGVNCLDFHQNGNTLLSGSVGGIVNVWDFRTRRISNTIEAHKRGVVITRWMDEKRFVSEGRDGYTKIYDTRNLDSPFHQIETNNITFVKGDLIIKNEGSFICLPDPFESSQWNLWSLELNRDVVQSENQGEIEGNKIEISEKNENQEETEKNTSLIQTVLPPKSDSKLGMLMGLHSFELKDKSDTLIFCSFESGEKKKKIFLY